MLVRFDVVMFWFNHCAGMCCADVELRLPISPKIRHTPLHVPCLALPPKFRPRSVSYPCSSVSTNLGDMANPGVGSAIYDKITNVVTWKAEKVLAGQEALIRITMMQGSDEPLSINVQVERLRLPPVFSFIDGFFRCREFL